MTARLMAQSLIDAGDNLVILTPVWPNSAAAVTTRQFS
jgi:aspartate/methionine/tyrosine aminotransferase